MKDLKDTMESTESVDEWDTGTASQIAHDCTYVSDTSSYTIMIPLDIQKVIAYLRAKIVSEWQMLLSGTVDDSIKLVTVTGYYIPKQEVTGATVTNLDIIDGDLIRKLSIVATIHSHSTMQVSFSSTDMDFTNMSQIKHHIVTNNRADYKATSRIVLPCGYETFVDTDIMLEDDEKEDISVIGLDNISKSTFKPVIYPTPYTYDRRPRYLTDANAKDDEWSKSVSNKDKGLLLSPYENLYDYE